MLKELLWLFFFFELLCLTDLQKGLNSVRQVKGSLTRLDFLSWRFFLHNFPEKPLVRSH